MVNQEDKLALLRDLLLSDNTSFAKKLSQRVATLEATLNEQQLLSEKVRPIIAEDLSIFIEEMPATLGPTITKTLKEEIKNSQDEVVEALFPIMGKMIKKYVAHEMTLLKESINAKTKNIFSFASFKRKAKSKFTGVTEEDLIIGELAEPRIEEIFVIEKNSGIILGHHSKTDRIDKDMVSGMMTAIKSFAEDAFGGRNENLETISYENYNIHIQNFHKIYVAAVISGSYTQMYKEVLENELLDFSETLSKNKNQLSCDELLMKFYKDE